MCVSRIVMITSYVTRAGIIQLLCAPWFVTHFPLSLLWAIRVHHKVWLINQRRLCCGTNSFPPATLFTKIYKLHSEILSLSRERERERERPFLSILHNLCHLICGCPGEVSDRDSLFLRPKGQIESRFFPNFLCPMHWVWRDCYCVCVCSWLKCLIHFSATLWIISPPRKGAHIDTDRVRHKTIINL